MAFAQVRHGWNIQLLPYFLVTYGSDYLLIGGAVRHLESLSGR